MGNGTEQHSTKHFHHSFNEKADLLRPPGDEHPKGLAEEGGEEGVKGRWTFQEGVHLVQQGRVRGQLFINLWIHHDISIFLWNKSGTLPVVHRR